MPFEPKQPPKATPRRRGLGLFWLGKLARVSVGLATFLIALPIRACFGLASSLRKVQRRDRIFAFLLLLAWMAIILSNFFLRGSYVFEGNLLVTEMSFTYTGYSEKRLLHPIYSARGLDLQGSLTEPLFLRGGFYSDSDPMLNQMLNELDQLSITFPYPTSRLIVTPIDESQPSQISIFELNINPVTRVDQLTYNSNEHQLSLCLLMATSPPKICIYPDSQLANPAEADSESIGQLRFKLGQQPLTMRLKLVDIPELDIQADIDSPQELTFQLTPNNNNELLIEPLSPTNLAISLPTFPEPTDVEAVNLPAWLRGDIDVADVKFTRFDITEDVTDELKTSTILNGEVRMEQELMKVLANQFLIVQSETPGIRKIRDIQITSQPPKGLRTLISGESKGIAVGLYPEFPVQSIEPSWLSKHLSQEAVNSLLAFIGALTAILLLPRLFPDPPSQ